MTLIRILLFLQVNSMDGVELFMISCVPRLRTGICNYLSQLAPHMQHRCLILDPCTNVLVQHVPWSPCHKLRLQFIGCAS